MTMAVTYEPKLNLARENVEFVTVLKENLMILSQKDSIQVA